MPMVEGTIVVDPLSGFVTHIPPTGPNASKEAFDALLAGTVIPITIIGPDLATAHEGVAAMARAIVKAVLHVQVNALVAVTSSGTTAQACSAGGAVGTATTSGTGTVT